MTPPSLVSVIIPTYDRAELVVDAVESVLAQTYPAFECLVVDDGSTDATLEVLEEQFGEEARVRVVAGGHAGVSAARNRGLAVANGELVTFLDSDDLMVPNRLARQLERLEDPTIDAVLGRAEQASVGGAPYPDWMLLLPRDLWPGYYQMSILLATRHAREVGGFDEALSMGEDTDFLVRLAGAGVRLGLLDEIVLIRRFHGGNVTYGLAPGDQRAIFRSLRGHLARRRGTSTDGTAPGP